MRGDSAQEAAALGARAREGASGPSVLHPVHRSPPVTTGHHPGQQGWAVLAGFHFHSTAVLHGSRLWSGTLLR